MREKSRRAQLNSKQSKRSSKRAQKPAQKSTNRTLSLKMPAYFSADLPSQVLIPRVVFVGSTLALIVFGLVMVYSASFVMGITSTNEDPSGYLVRQLISIAIGFVLCVILARFDYRKYSSGLVFILAGVSAVLLIGVLFLGMASHGAYRWIPIGPLTIQPSEFVKAIVIICASVFCYQYKGAKTISTSEFALRMVVVCGGLLCLILAQPDMGTTMTLAATIWATLFVAGVNRKFLVLAIVVLLLAFFGLGIANPYARERLNTMLNPQDDPYGSGYQLLQGWYAFGSGGLSGLGLGMSRQKYSYLPEMHNDFIFAVIGEELGFLGCIVVLLLFLAFLWSCIQIAKQAPDLLGKLIAYCSGVLIVLAVLLNVLGVLGMVPLSGKAIPFISYGGSAMMGSLMLVGLVFQVSLHAEVRSKRARKRAERTKPPRLKTHVGGKARS